MPSKKKKYNARFPAGRIKKIMQTDEEVGKVAQAVPVIISRTLELFVESLLTKAMQITSAKNAKTLSPSHMKQCILSEQRFDFLKDLVKSVQDSSNGEDDGMAAAVSSGNSLLTPAPHRSVSERRKSSSSSVKQEATVVKEELVIRDVKQGAIVVKEELVIKDEPVESPQPSGNCSALSQSFYSVDRAAEPTASIHSQQLLAPSPPASPSPILVMDEDYDT